MNLAATLRGTTHRFADVKEVLAKANEEKSGDRLAGVAAAIGLGARGGQARARRADAAGAARKPGRAARARRGHAADPRRPAAPGLRVDEVLDRRQAARARARRRDRRRRAAAPVARAVERDDRRVREADDQPRPDLRRAQDPGRGPRHQHRRARGAAVGAPAAESPVGLDRGDPRVDARRPVVRLRRRGHRHQPGHRQSGADRGDPERVGGVHAAVAHPHAELLPGARDDADEGAGEGRRAGPDVPVDRRHGKGAAQLRRDAADARRGARDDAQAGPVRRAPT